MRNSRPLWNIWLAALALASAPASGAAQMCGGHSGHSMSEHKQQEAELTATDVADVVSAYVREAEELNGGYFLVYDPERNAPVALELDRVRADRLHQIEDRKYFACADFKTPDGEAYDVDVFLRGPNRERLEVTEIAVHAQNGVRRYDWQVEDDGQWKRKRIAATERARGEQQLDAAESRYEISVDAKGFHPNDLWVKAGAPVTLVVTRKTDRTCAKEIVIRSLDIAKELPLEEPVVIVLDPDGKGDIPFGCGMNMLTGVIHVE